MTKKGEKILTQKQVCELGLDKVSVITADMLEGYTSIESYAFYGCTGLKSIVIPDRVTSVGEYAFSECSALTSVTIGNSVTSIGEYAFTECSALTSVTIPDSVTSIVEGAFYDCSGLKSIEIPNSVTSIEYLIFAYCSSLTSVTIGDKTYEKQVIKDGKCKAYKAFKADMTCRGFQYEESKTYEFDGESKLCMRGFHACLNLADVFTYYCGKLGKDLVIHEVELEGVSDEYYVDSKVVAKKITIGKRIL